MEELLREERTARAGTPRAGGWSGRTGHVVVAVGLAHLAVWAWLARGGMIGMAQAGLVNTVGAEASRLLFWYGGILAGLGLLLLGCALVSFARATGLPAPAYSGWALAGWGAAGLVSHLVSGAALVLAAGLLIVGAARRPARRRKVADQ